MLKILPLCKLVFGGRLLLKHNVRKITFPTFSSSPPGSTTFLSSGPLEEDNSKMPVQLNVLKDAYKLRINQLRLKRVGLKPTSKECIREFEVVDTLKDNQPLLFIQLHYAVKVEKYDMSAFAYSPEHGGSAEGPVLINMLLERNTKLRTTAARIYSPPERPIAYIYPLAGVHPTVIIEDGQAIKCLYQLLSVNAFEENRNARIYSARGNVRLGHFTCLTEGYTRWEQMFYVRLHPELDITSKSILIGAALYTMGYGHK